MITHKDGKVYWSGEHAWPGFTFSDVMRQAHDDGRKVMTRRLIKNIPENTLHFEDWIAAPTCVDKEPGTWGLRPVYDTGLHPVIFPLYQVDQLVYLKEPLVCGGDSCVYYSSDQKPVIAHDTLMSWIWQRPRLPAISMPGIAARHIDRITEVRAERLQDITPRDIVDEGLYDYFMAYGREKHFKQFAELWDSINPKHPWASNPWVLVYEWEVVI